ncbi:MAG: 3-deoxy-7-phosphoheptulonate synthase [Deltaproteobacteria bacterium RIFOXYA12_FULL_61_11]|nr:MAG: 3-deoxy-7-phosphoheptulonate synthase [Deltaproteobacteria bacterium RIFOXYA12_FULL_61_11]
MIIVMQPKAPKAQIDALLERIVKSGCKPYLTQGVERTVINVLGDLRTLEPERDWAAFPGIEQILRIQKPYKLASKEHAAQRTAIELDGVCFGDRDFVFIAGPCSVEGRTQVFEAASMLVQQGFKVMRASAFKPRTSPYEFQGLGKEGLKLLREVKKQTGLLVETEITDVRAVEWAPEYVDIVRVGSRNMHNSELLKEMGKLDLPVILKRGLSATIKEFIMAAEYILKSGNSKVIFCERGIRTYETTYRNTLDISAVIFLKHETHLPVIVDPSHAAGNRLLIPGLCRAALAAGADGLLVEAHPKPEQAFSDGAQSLGPEQLAEVRADLATLAPHFGRRLV